MTLANVSTLAVGLSSGTSMDGIDAALVRVGGETATGLPCADARSTGAALEVLAFHAVPYADELHRALRCAPTDADATALALLDAAVGEAFATAALAVLADAGVAAAAVRCIGSHGQTLMHVPQPRRCGGYAVRASLQIGSASVIAERTGITTVADFRARDLAAGGQGAPLVPLLDHRLYTDATRDRVALNLGGIANLTALPAAGELAAVTAFDTGPGNVLLDAAARHRGIGDGFDDGGKLAAHGTVDDDLLVELLRNPFYQRRPPKSADTVDLLDDAARSMLESSALSDADLLATLCELTARTIGDAIAQHVSPHLRVRQVVVSGGGTRNDALMARLAAHLRPAGVIPCTDIVPEISAAAKEAVLFALLGHEALAGRPGNVASATGAAGPRVLGAIVPGV